MRDLIPRGQVTPSERGGVPVSSANNYQLEYWVEPPQAPEEPSFLQFLYQVFRRRKWLILVIALVIPLTTALQLATTSPFYRSTVKIQIDPDPSYALPYQDLSEATIDFFGTDAYLQTQKEVLQSEGLALRVVKRLRLQQDPAFNSRYRRGILIDLPLWFANSIREVVSSRSEGPSESATLEKLLQNLEVKIIPGTRLLEIHYLSHNPLLARTIVNAYVDEYVDNNFETNQGNIHKALRKQLTELKDALLKSEAELIAYSRQHGILNLDQGQQITLQKLTGLNAEVIRAEARLMEQEALRAILSDASVDNFPRGLVNDSISELQSRLADLRQKQAGLSSRFGRNWPESLQVEKEVEQLEEQLRREKRRALEQTNRDYRATKRHYELLSGKWNRQRQAATRLDSGLMRYALLKQEVETNRELHNALRQRLKETAVSAGLKTTNIRMLQQGRLPQDVDWPQKGRFFVLSVLLGFLFGFGAAFVLEYADKTVKTSDDVERFFALPCLSMIPAIKESSEPGRPLLLATGENTDGGLPVLGESKALYAEAVRSLRNSLFMAPSGRPKRIMITSALPGEGKTTTAVNTAIAIARTGVRTLLIDMDLRHPKIAGIFGVNEDQGLTYFLLGDSNIYSQVRTTAVPDLFLLSAGPTGANTAELLAAERLDDALDQLSELFDAIVIDTPPVLPFTDALVLSRKVDQVILVVQAEKTPKDAIKKAHSQLTRVQANVIGMAVNAVDVEKFPESYGYYREYYSKQNFETEGDQQCE